MARGFYRSICAALHDDPKFQNLSPPARHILLTLRTNRFNNAAGIYIFDNGSFVTLMDHTGYNAEELEKALAELCDKQWIAYQYPILWIIKSLADEPNISLTNPKHKTAVLSIIESLPQLGLIANFCDEYNLKLPPGYPSERVPLPSQYPIRYRRALEENRISINNIPAEQLQLVHSDNSSLATPDSQNTKISESDNSGNHEPITSPPPSKEVLEKSVSWMDKILILQQQQWGDQPLIPSMINKLVNERFGTYAALYCAIEAVKKCPNDAIGYFTGIGKNTESVDNYQKIADQKHPPAEILELVGCKLNNITQSKTGT